MLCLLSCDKEENKAQIHTLWSQVSVPLHYSWYFSVYLLLLRKTWILWVFFLFGGSLIFMLKKIPKEYMVCHGIILFPCWILSWSLVQGYVVLKPHSYFFHGIAAQTSEENTHREAFMAAMAALSDCLWKSD